MTIICIIFCNLTNIEVLGFVDLSGQLITIIDYTNRLNDVTFFSFFSTIEIITNHNRPPYLKTLSNFITLSFLNQYLHS